MNSAFYSNESDVLVRQVETSTEKESEWTSEEIDTYVKTSANWIKQNNFQKVRTLFVFLFLYLLSCFVGLSSIS